MNDKAIRQRSVILKGAFKNGCRLLIKKCWMPLAILIITMALLFSVFRALTPWAKQYKGDVERHLSTLIGQPVLISSMETSWYWFEPVLRLNHVTVSDSQDHILRFSKLLVGINLLSSLWHWHIQPGILYVDDVHLTVHQNDDHWDIDGLLNNTKPSITLEPESYLPVLSWLLGQQKIIIKNVTALVYLKDGTLLPLSGLNLTALNYNGHCRLKGVANLAQGTPTELIIAADVKVNPYSLGSISGHAYFAVKHFVPTQWSLLFPETPYNIKGGKGGFELWLDVARGHISGVQSRIHFNHIAWSSAGNPQTQFIQKLRANLAWNSTQYGWKLSGDHIKLYAGDTRWPDNTLLVNFNQSQQTYRLFVKTLLLDPLLALDIKWPAVMQPLLDAHPSGQLDDTQVGIRKGQLDYVLARFSGLNWKGFGQTPSVSNISGVLNWQPVGGRLEIDGENTTVTSHGHPPVVFDKVNGAFQWKKQGDGLGISMERFVLIHPDLVLSAHGNIDGLFVASSPQVQLTADFSAEQATKWLKYIPSQYLKPKLNAWLKHDIKRIDKVLGKMTIKGAWADFPYDLQPGEFSVDSRLSGVDLIFNKNWPLSRDINASLRVKKRTLEADISHASMHGVTVSQVNLRVDELGMDKETLLIHGKLETPANKALRYIFASPLRHQLLKLKKLDLNGLLGLDLRLEVPLYPENDDVLVRGAIIFNNNQATFHHALNNFQLSDLSGSLYFDENGVTDSELNASLWNDPVAMHIRSIAKPKSATEITIAGKTTVDVLREKFDSPLFSFMKGQLNLESKLTLTASPNGSDSILMSTSLQGIEIQLPPPFGKAPEELAPLTIKVNLGPEQRIRLRLDYENRLSSDLSLTESNGAFLVEKGAIHIGGGNEPVQKKSGLQVVGTLVNLDIQQWRDIFAKWPSNPSSSKLLDNLQFVDMTLDKVALWGKNYPQVAIKADKLSKLLWSFKLEQRDIAGSLQYNIPSNTISGRLARLYLTKSDVLPRHGKASTERLKPTDIPNLNLTVDAFKWGDVSLGKVTMKSTSTDANWHLDSCTVTSPAYQLTMKGNWKQNGNKNNTDLQGNLQISKLEDGLEALHITPVVEAHKGNIQFEGTWPGAINEFSLAHVDGQILMNIKDGRITHLSPETEEKLGLGKLLSILSLQTIPRRLKLDFSDLSQEGYSFDDLKGNFTLKNGVMHTSDSYIDGPVAYASMKGNLDVVKQKYDVDLHISPHITASLPIVATIAGGPIAGIATWAASKIINQGMQTVTGYTYQISGPWSNPVVEQVSIFKKSTK